MFDGARRLNMQSAVRPQRNMSLVTVAALHEANKAPSPAPIHPTSWTAHESRLFKEFFHHHACD
jgi:hypothetical protein